MRIPRVVVTVMLVCLPMQAGTLDMQIDSVFTNGRFDFTRLISEPIDPPAPQPKPSSLMGSTKSYEIWMDRDGVGEVSQLNYFRYNIYVRPNANRNQVTRVAFNGKPTGTFDDQLVDVHFQIIDGAVTEDGRMTLPIFGSVASDAISSSQPSEPNSVHLATETEIPIPLTNQLKEMGVDITSAAARSKKDSALWGQVEMRGESSAFAPFHIDKGAKNDTSLQIKLVPRTAHAFMTSLIRGRDNDDDVIGVSLTYKTLGRDERPANVDVHVRFVPWPPVLILVSFAASILGWLVLVLVKAKREPWEDRLRILGSGAAAAVLIEVVGMALVIGKSEFKFLGITLDPFQMVAAAAVGFVAGLAGYKSRELLRRVSETEFFKFGGAGTHAV